LHVAIYLRATILQIKSTTKGAGGAADGGSEEGVAAKSTGRPNAAITILVKNSPKDLGQLPSCLRSIDQHFNNQYHYPLVIFHDSEKPLDAAQQDRIRKMTKSNLNFEVVSWTLPAFYAPFMDHKKQKIRGREGYKKMCRFWSGGLFYESTTGQKYDWIMRMDSDSQFTNRVTFDMFQRLQDLDMVCVCVCVTHWCRRIVL